MLNKLTFLSGQITRSSLRGTRPLFQFIQLTSIKHYTGQSIKITLAKMNLNWNVYWIGPTWENKLVHHLTFSIIKQLSKYKKYKLVCYWAFLLGNATWKIRTTAWTKYMLTFGRRVFKTEKVKYWNFKIPQKTVNYLRILNMVFKIKCMINTTC